jgi:uncharacterized protein with PQ loop repeat
VKWKFWCGRGRESNFFYFASIVVKLRVWLVYGVFVKTFYKTMFFSPYSALYMQVANGTCSNLSPLHPISQLHVITLVWHGTIRHVDHFTEKQHWEYFLSCRSDGNTWSKAWRELQDFIQWGGEGLPPAWIWHGGYPPINLIFLGNLFSGFENLITLSVHL